MKRARNYSPVWLLLLLGLMAFLSLSCRPEPVAPEEGRILIIDPSAESTLRTQDVTISTFVEYFTLVDKTGQTAIPGEGHIIYYLDVTPPLEKGRPATTAPGSFVVSADKSYTWMNVPPGNHTFWVQLVNNDDTPIEPPSAVRVPLTLIR